MKVSIEMTTQEKPVNLKLVKKLLRQAMDSAITAHSDGEGSTSRAQWETSGYLVSLSVEEASNPAEESKPAQESAKKTKANA